MKLNHGFIKSLMANVMIVAITVMATVSANYPVGFDLGSMSFYAGMAALVNTDMDMDGHV